MGQGRGQGVTKLLVAQASCVPPTLSPALWEWVFMTKPPLWTWDPEQILFHHLATSKRSTFCVTSES